jgi:hypothetical protein
MLPLLLLRSKSTPTARATDYTGYTGGNARVVGFEQAGELHSDAFVFLSPKGIDPLRPPTKFKRGTKWLTPSKPEVSAMVYAEEFL